MDNQITLEQACQAAIEKYAPAFRQLNAARYHEYEDYIDIVIQLYRDHYRNLKEAGDQWRDLPAEALEYLQTRKPY